MNLVKKQFLQRPCSIAVVSSYGGHKFAVIGRLVSIYRVYTQRANSEYCRRTIDGMNNSLCKKNRKNEKLSTESRYCANLKLFS